MNDVYEYNLDKIEKFYKKVAKRGGSKVMTRELAIKMFAKNAELDLSLPKIIQAFGLSKMTQVTEDPQEYD